MANISYIILIPVCALLIILMDRIYPRKLLYFFIYYAWALGFCNFLIVIKSLVSLIKYYEWDDGLIVHLWYYWYPNTSYSIFGTWINCEWLSIDWLFTAGVYELIMLAIVTFISSIVQLYSINYMIFDDYKKFTIYITIFTIFMIVLVSAGNFLVLFVGWEGVGLCSYLLINFWYTRINANLAAMKALIVNRIADMALTIGIILIFLTFLSVDFEIIFPLVPFFINEKLIILNFDLNILMLIGLLIFIGAMGKSAQIGLHTWLPDAMEGPTPVSALIHAATMVTAGVFLLIKCSPLFEYLPNMLNLIIFVGAFSAFFSALIGLVQNDIKKIIAYSTCSQLGYMIFCCGLSAYDISFFHLINHAFFKALLFLGAGSLIHSLSNEQDLRKYGISIFSNGPFIYIMFLIGSFALIGFPFLTGFYSKDLILEIAYSKFTIIATFSYFIGIITAFATAIYSFRIIYLTFVFEKNILRRFLNFDTSIFFSIPLCLLAIGSLIFGYIMKDLFIGLGSNLLSFTIYISPQNNFITDAEFFGWAYNQRYWWIKLLPFLVINIALIVVLVVNNNSIIILQKHNYFQLILSKKFFFDIFYNKFVVNGIMFLSYEYLYKYLDKILFEIFGPHGLSYIISNISLLIRKIHFGFIFVYIIYFFVLLAIMLIIPLLYNDTFGIL